MSCHRALTAVDESCQASVDAAGDSHGCDDSDATWAWVWVWVWAWAWEWLEDERLLGRSSQVLPRVNLTVEALWPRRKQLLSCPSSLPIAEPHGGLAAIGLTS